MHTSLISQRLTKSCVSVVVNGKVANALTDSGSTGNIIHPRLVERCALDICSNNESVCMASSSSCARLQGHCTATLTVQDRTYSNVKFMYFQICEPISFLVRTGRRNIKASLLIMAIVNLCPPLKICNSTSLNVCHHHY